MKKNKLNNIKTTGFKTPNHYFESLDASVFNKLNKDIPTIKNIEQTGFTAPYGYFNQLDDAIFNKLKDNKSKPVISFFSRNTIYVISGIAASILLLLSIVVNKPNNSDALSLDMVETYFSHSDLNTYELAELLADAKLLDEDFIVTDNNLNEDSIKQYLLNHSDIESILE